MFKKSDLVRSVSIVTVNDARRNKLVKRGDLGQVLNTNTLDYGQGRTVQKVQVLWLAGEGLGTTSILNYHELMRAS